jgi:4-alpha-glucanotransferase
LLATIAEEARGAHVVAEDLGVVPTFVRETMQELGLPGYRVIPWEKDDGRMRDPRAFPHVSVASYSTHDTQPITAWWDVLPEGDRAQLAHAAGFALDAPEEPRTLALFRLLFDSRSELTLVLAQELLGERARINMPATVGSQNWSWRLPAPIEDLDRDPRVRARLDRVRASVEASGRVR